MPINTQITAIILASGMSKRMGTAKQLLRFNGIPLLESVIQKLLLFPFHQIYAIIGHHSKEIMRTIQIEDQRFQWIINEMYPTGQSAALKKAVKTVGDVDGMMVFLADQPLILEDTIWLVINGAESLLEDRDSKFVVQPAYSGKKGHPVFFSHSLFPFFEMLDGDEGGKRVINQAEHHHVITVEDAGILLDIDTPEDYRNLLKKDQ